MIANVDKFDVICNTVDNGIILINKNLEVKFWNRWLEIRTGISAKNIINKNLKDFYPQIDDKKLIRKVTTALKLNSSTFYTPQSSKFLINIELSKVADKVFNEMQQSVTITPYDLEKELAIIYIYDTTILSEINYKLKEVKEEVEEKNEELKLLFDTTMEAIIVFKDNKIVNCNQIAIELCNHKSKESLINKDIKDLNLNQNILEKVHTKPVEVTITREDKTTFKALVNIKNTTIKTQNFKVLTIIDISEIKRKENLLAEQTKMAAMGEMIGNIAHQWRQPLNIISITSSSTKLKKEIGLLTDKMLVDALKLISETTEHLSNTIDVFKDFLKEDKEKSLFNLTQNINNNISLIETILNENRIRIELDLDEDIYIYNFTNEFSQALINILHNASDAIASKREQDELRLIKITTKQLEDSVLIEILDNAGGIDKEIINKIYEPYFTTKHKYQGTGLGLYMTHKIIQDSMKGKISVSNQKFVFENQECEGALFQISLKNNT
ncbi:PAS sensor-containing two-component system histidine kinase [Arcobacter venerupis]|uniref:histidine kinase n=1 Tax=Arcobacter venerupis TaxID=1054033 RepID=A0AAE7B815_9BACT|nr:ATP-binding protein [Arcobacter venerupis]QKF67004.1 PAS sensor-containing two-component system histidine kinase [Arcobacter venerupis]RWS50047.1 PAS domain-containing sensor histidine kinase [Arcobacter venerupis]